MMIRGIPYSPPAPDTGERVAHYLLNINRLSSIKSFIDVALDIKSLKPNI